MRYVVGAIICVLVGFLGFFLGAKSPATALSSIGLADPPEESVLEALPEHLEARIRFGVGGEVINDIAEKNPEIRDQWISVKRWKPGDIISVCYFGGSAELRKKISLVASAWNNVGARVRLNFGNLNNPPLCRPNDNYDVRVGFSYPGYWSLIGTDSLTVASRLEQSMNLARFDISPPGDQEFTRVVLHEFGHALGLNHEHQAPKSKCEEEFNWDYIYNYLSGPPNNWNRQKIDYNLRRGTYHDGDYSSSFDRQSIMLYTFPRSFYKVANIQDSACFSEGNFSLSPGDKSALIAAYVDEPTPAQVQAEIDLSVAQAPNPQKAEVAAREVLEPIIKEHMQPTDQLRRVAKSLPF